MVGPGVLDHHAPTLPGPASTSALVVKHPEHVYLPLMGGLDAQVYQPGAVRERTSIPLTLVIRTHRNPEGPEFFSLDTLIAIYLAMQIVEEGGLASWAWALAEYATSIVQGKVQWRSVAEGRPDLSVLHRALMASNEDPLDKDRPGDPLQARLQTGLQLLATMAAELDQTDRPETGWSASSIAEWIPEATRTWQDCAPHLLRWIEGDEAAWSDDRQKIQHRRLRVPIRQIDGTLIRPSELDAGVVEFRPRSLFFRERARKDYPVLLVAQEKLDPVAGDADPQALRHRRITVSVDPLWDPNSGAPNTSTATLTLSGLGRRLEALESAKRSALGAAFVRGGRPRHDDGTCDNADPWYDGRQHQYTLVESPRCGTVLGMEDVLQELSTPFWETRILAGWVILARIDATEPASESGERLYSPQDVSGMVTCGEPLDWKGLTATREQGVPSVLQLLVWSCGSATAKGGEPTLEKLVDELKQKRKHLSSETRRDVYAFAAIHLEPGLVLEKRVEDLLRAAAGAGTLCRRTEDDESPWLVARGANSTLAMSCSCRRVAAPPPDPEPLLHALLDGWTIRKLLEQEQHLELSKADRWGMLPRAIAQAARQHLARVTDFETHFLGASTLITPEKRALRDLVADSLGLPPSLEALRRQSARIAEQLKTHDRQIANLRNERLNFGVSMVGIVSIYQSVAAVSDLASSYGDHWYYALIPMAFILAALVWMLWLPRQQPYEKTTPPDETNDERK
jgi:hypothetical protein